MPFTPLLPVFPLVLVGCIGLPSHAGTLRPDGGVDDTEESTSERVRALEYAELHAALERIVSENPAIASMRSVGESRGGLSMDALRLTGASDPERTPAMLLIANLEGPRLFESGVALHHAERLVADYATDEEVRALLDSTVIWILPRANPDPAEAHFEKPGSENWTAPVGVDIDRDGAIGENGSWDMNGDGLITKMRVLDPEGEWIEDPTDARVMVKADASKGEAGRWKVYPESRDMDGDDDYGEDPPGNTRVDRNFPSGWDEHAHDSGVFPTSEHETRALCDFVMAHKNLALIVAYDGLDNLVEQPDSVDDDARPVKRVPPPGILASDAKLLEELGRRYKKATEDESKGSGDTAGTFTRWCYDHRGILALETVLWNLPTEAPEAEAEPAEEDGEAESDAEGLEPEADPEAEEVLEEEESEGGETEEEDKEPSMDAKHLSWIDAVEESWRFVDWQTFEHPDLGEVEIGGFAPNARLVPPLDSWDAIADTHYEWFLGLGALLPRLALEECTREELGPGLWRVRATVTNASYLPLLTRSGRRTRTTRPARVRLRLGDGASLVAGKMQELLSDLPGSGGRAEFTWLVQAAASVTIEVEVDTDHAGSLSKLSEVIQ